LFIILIHPPETCHAKTHDAIYIINTAKPIANATTVIPAVFGVIVIGATPSN
jgi:hypothetical protein